jgi:16S rRNA processing protein RimM
MSRSLASGGKAGFFLNKCFLMPDYYKVGKIAAVHGVKGEVVFQHTLGKKTALKDVTAIFTEDKQNSFFPWFIADVKIKSPTEVYLKLEGIDTREAASTLNQKELWLPEPDFKKIAAKSAPVSLLGYIIVDDKKELGPILELIEQPHQLLCRLEINKKEVLIPLHEETLVNINHRKKQVLVNLPEGLLEIYL